ncbi:MAG: hypothetical protein KME17_08310 [Cyanosarcina radialis HA8281-LM2]|nr:hypothetical protein [Cyanosarcina radialis HA8281-LM2]
MVSRLTKLVCRFARVENLKHQNVFSDFSKLLHRTGGEFWLPLPSIALLLWFLGNGTAALVLNRSYDSASPLPVDRRLAANLSVAILAINAEIDRRRGVTTVLVKTADPTLNRTQYEFPVVRADRVEAALARELKIPASKVKKLIGYRIKD